MFNNTLTIAQRTIQQLLRDRRTIALILIVWAVFAIFGMAASGFGAILFTLGIYLLIRAMWPFQ